MHSCSTKKNKRINRFYHNTTSRFNGYFNGNETIKEAEAMLKTAHRDNYYKIIPVYPVGTLEDSKTILPLSDKAIKKASVVIAKHSMMIRGKEYCKYIDDSYLLIGKSMFYKRDYYASLEMFAYVARDPVKNNKKDPIQHLANIWLSRAYGELGMFSDARLAIDRSLNDKAMPESVKGAVYQALTDHHLKQNKYPEALEAVDEALKHIKKKKRRTRLLFIRGQLQQKLGELKKASDSYAKVLKSNPSYEMAFYSQINIARCFDAESRNSKEIRELLAKMLDDPKNFEFNDQIHYVLGELELKEANEAKAIEEFNTSIRVSTNNNNQKGMSYLAIAEINFEDRKYRPAAAYYDSAITNLNIDYPDYKKIEIKRNSLAELVKKYITIEKYDSLLRMSNLSGAELDKAVMDIIEKEEEARKRQQEKDALALIQNSTGGAGVGNNNTGGPAGGGNGLWYFYNPSAKGFGFTEFRKIWGERKLEDDWRRKNKQPSAPTQNVDDPVDVPVDDKGEPVVMTREDSIAQAKERLLAGLPKDEDQKRAFADSVMEAFYDIGMIYKERLKDLNAASETYEEFLRKYPRSKNEATIYYQLYRIYLSMPDAVKAEKYKQLILNSYPDSDYAALITDPEFFKKENMSQAAVEKFYSETYRMYQAGQYDEVLSRSRQAETRYQGNELAPKFALLKALATGKMKDVEAFRMSLQSVVANFPMDTVRVKAEQLLKSLDRVQGIAVKDTVKTPEKPSFTYVADTVHYFLIIIENKTLDINPLKINISDFNNEFFSVAQLKINNRLLGTNYQLISIERFLNKKEAMDYYKVMVDDDFVLQDIDPQILETFAISVANYNLLMKEGNVREYVDFFRRVYE